MNTMKPFGKRFLGILLKMDLENNQKLALGSGAWLRYHADEFLSHRLRRGSVLLLHQAKQGVFYILTR